jgi:hypothetical protein
MSVRLFIEKNSMKKLNAEVKVIAFYLPQYHPIPENDKWWGKGFTEWTNVGKAKKYFLGHNQPRIPADLGYYDLRIPQVRQAQANLAQEAGIVAFCYWHYWFGNGKQLLEMPIQEVVRLGEPNFPFCLGWANHSWINKSWDRDEKLISKPKVLLEQKYPGKKDIDDHFFKMLPVFKDGRYYKIHKRLVFLIFKPSDIPDFKYFKTRWNELANENGLPGFFFIANSMNTSDLGYDEYDAISLCTLYRPFGVETSIKNKILRFVLRGISFVFGYSLNVIRYSEATKKMLTPHFKEDRIYPNIIPNWDDSPRRKMGTFIFKNSTPELFKRYVKQVLQYLSEKKEEDKIIFLKSWNEWAEGNYLEPDIKWGKAYIRALREALEE